MKTLFWVIILILPACTGDLQRINIHTQENPNLSHAGFYDFYLDAAAGHVELWENKQLFENINFAGFTATVKFFDIFPHEKWLSGLRFSLSGNNPEAEHAVIDLLLKRKNNRIALMVKPPSSSDTLITEHFFLLDEYIQFQVFINSDNQLNIFVNGTPESFQLNYKPTAMQANAIGSDAHITLDIYESI